MLSSLLRHRSIRTSCKLAGSITTSPLSKIVIGNYNYHRLRPFATTSSSQDSTTGFSNRTLLLYSAIGGLVITVVGAVRKIHDEVGSTEGLKRAISFYSLAIPKYIEYQWHLWRQSSDEVWDDLHTRTSQVGLDKIMELRGFYVKCGQMCAANIGDAFPEIWQDTMSVLQDQVPAEDYETIRKVIDSEMDFDKVFASFEKEPIGAASIGQVHRATLKDGRNVVVKVRYPEVERLLRGDVRTIKMFAQLAQPVHVPALEEIEKQFMTEFDYRQEALQMAKVRENLTRAGLAGPGKLCLVPQPYLELCTTKVLVMEELKGDKLVVGLKRDAQVLAQRAGLTIDDFKAANKLKERQAKAKGETIQGPSAKEYDMYISILDGKRKIENAGRMTHNVLLGWLPGFSWKSYQDLSTLPINHAKMVDDLLKIHGHEVLVDGYFNGDPHPGNILMIYDDNGKPQLGLIDYGQVKSLTKEQRHLVCKLVIALAEDNRDDVVRLMKEAGYKSKRMDPANIYLYAKIGYDEDNDKLTGGKHIQLFMEELEKNDPIESLPRDIFMVSRASVLLRGFAHALHQHRSVAKAWKPIAEQVLREES